MTEVKSYHLIMHMVMTMRGPGMTLEIPMKVEGDYAGQENSHTTTEMTFFGQKQVVETISVDGKVFVRAPGDARWQMIDKAMLEADPDLNPTGIFGNDSPWSSTTYEEMLEDVQVVGDEQIDGVETYHITGTMLSVWLGPGLLEAGMKQDEPFKVDLWIGKHDSLTYKFTMSGTLAMNDGFGTLPTSVGESVFMKMEATARYSQFNQPVTIVAPESFVPQG